MFVKTNTHRHLIAKASNRKNQKQKSNGESKIRTKKENKTTYPATTLGSSPTGSPELESWRTGEPGLETELETEWRE